MNPARWRSLDNDEIVYIARSATSRITAVAPTVGSRLPAYCTSMGRVLLSQLTEREVNAYLARVELRPLVHRTVTSPEKLRQLLLEASKSMEGEAFHSLLSSTSISASSAP